jgi:hypothetical protein
MPRTRRIVRFGINMTTAATCSIRWDGRLVPPNANVTPAQCISQPASCIPPQLSSSYDGMNRLQSKAYNDTFATAPTPSVSYGYDAGGSTANANGRLTSVQAGSALYSRTYDTMGRVHTSTQSTAGTSYPAMSYGYDLTGALRSFTFPLGRQQSIANGAWTQKYCQSADRLQITGVRQVLGQNAPPDCSFGGGDLLNLAFVYGASEANNGNVSAQQIRNGSLNLTQSFTSDAYNRLFSASESAGGATQWTQTYGYDAWGNRAVAAGLRPDALGNERVHEQSLGPRGR